LTFLLCTEGEYIDFIGAGEICVEGDCIGASKFVLLLETVLGDIPGDEYNN